MYVAQLQEAAERRYIDGQPRYHQPQAAEVHPNPRREDLSAVFVITHEEFLKFSAMDIQQSLRDRHILIHGVPESRLEFKVDNVTDFVDPALPVTVYDASLTKDPSSNPTTVTTTLLDVFEQAEKDDNGHILHVPHLPLNDTLDRKMPALHVSAFGVLGSVMDVRRRRIEVRRRSKAGRIAKYGGAETVEVLVSAAERL